VFLIRGKDFAGPFAVQAWARRARKEGASPEIVQAAYDQAKRMQEWQKRHGGKVPDAPADACLSQVRVEGGNQ
jgi:hypothetical protein